MNIQRVMPPAWFTAAIGFLAHAMVAHAVDAPVEFSGLFAPTEGFVAASEKPLRDELCLNGRWQFQPTPVPGTYRHGSGQPPELPPPDPARWEKTPIKIPSPWNVNEWGNGTNCGNGTARPLVADSVYFPSYPKEWNGQRMGWLRRTFPLPAGWSGRRLMIHFEAVAGEAQVLVNGRAVGTHFDSFLPFDVDVTDAVKAGADNELLVGVRKSTLFNVITPGYPEGQQRTYPNGSNMDELVGIWNDVFLLAVPAVRVEDTFVQPNVDKNVLAVQVTLRNDSGRPQAVSVLGSVAPWVNLAGSDTLSAPVPAGRLDAPKLSLPTQNATVPPGGQTVVHLEVPVERALKTWTPDAPNLYGLVVTLNGAGDQALDRKYTRFGWRQFQIRGHELLLNGKSLQLWGDFCHPFGPFIGSRRYVWADYKLIKDFGGNMVRPHANVMPRLWMDLADEMGICVLSESSIFGSSIALNLREPVTWERFERHVDGLVLRDRNHPSILGWSPGNEMFALFLHTTPKDKEEQYPKLKALAQRPRKLDPTRDWLSMDGDKDLDGTLPVYSSYFGIGIPDNLPDVEKPCIIGEHGGTYFAAPPLLRGINGDRAYESYAGHNEALAIDLYRMVTQFAKPKLAAFSPSELVWFGLEQLPFGYRTDARPPDQKTDGVFFPSFVENTPGVQPERLPPYVTTLNPGFDPALPLYKPLAMFNALKAALDPRGPQPCPWDKLPAPSVPKSMPAATNRIATVGFFGEEGGALQGSLYELGLPLVMGDKAGEAELLILDDETMGDAEILQAKRAADAVAARGGLVWLMLRDPSTSVARWHDFLPADTEVTNRHASLLLHGIANPVFDGFSLNDFYFANQEDNAYIQTAGLGGSLTTRGKVLLSAANSDWTLFERSPEAIKCSSMLIYEHLKKPAGAALVELPLGAGRLWVSTLDATKENPVYGKFWAQVFRNMGVKLTAPPINWIIPPGKEAVTFWRYQTNPIPANFADPGCDDSIWLKGVVGFGSAESPNAGRIAWSGPEIVLRQEFILPSVPRSLRVVLQHTADTEVYLNGVRVAEDRGSATEPKQIVLSAKDMKAARVGKNILAVRCKGGGDEKFIDVGLSAGGSSPGAATEHDLLLDGPPQ